MNFAVFNTAAAKIDQSYTILRIKICNNDGVVEKRLVFRQFERHKYCLLAGVWLYESLKGSHSWNHHNYEAAKKDSGLRVPIVTWPSLVNQSF
jgi:hypothetical protein